jgi:hypothetical protein
MVNSAASLVERPEQDDGDDSKGYVKGISIGKDSKWDAERPTRRSFIIRVQAH